MTKYITPYDNDTFWGYRVSIQKKGIIITKYFSSTKLGDKEAKVMAIAYRDELLTALKSCKTAEDVLELRKNR